MIYTAMIFCCGLGALHYPFVFGHTGTGALGAALALLYLPYLLITRLIRLGSLRRGLDASEKALLFAWLFAGYAAFVGMSAAEYVYFGLKDSSGIEANDPAISLYFSLVTLTTLGYGDYSPHDNYGRLAAAWEAINGYIMMAVLVAVLIPVFGSRPGGRDGD